MNEKRKNTYDTLIFLNNFQIRLLLEAIIVGFFAGLVTVAYRLILQYAESYSKKLYLFISGSVVKILIWAIIAAVLAYVIGIMVKRNPMISGSGIPQVEGELSGYFEMNWLRTVLGKFIGGVISIGTGLSLGREGPSVQLGACVGKGVSRVFKRIKVEEKLLMTSGASAGLAAAFNAPFAGTMFALEEVHKSFSPSVLLAAMSSAVVSDFVSKEVFGLKPVFTFGRVQAVPLQYYGLIILLGIILGVAGVFYNKILLLSQKLYANQKWLKPEFRMIIPFLCAVALGLTLPEVLGGGHSLIESMIGGSYTLKMIVIILIVKFIFSMISFGSGAPGGIFFPLLVIGALIGAIYVSILTNFLGFGPAYVNNFIIFGMVGYFTAIVRAPITGIILILEMTGSFTHMLSLTIVSITAYIVANLMNSEPVYESLLTSFLRKKNLVPKELKRGSIHKVLIEMPVCYGSKLEGKYVKDFNWSKESLIVAITRGNKEITPKGDTVIKAGDYVLVLVPEDKETESRQILYNLTKENLDI